MKTTFSLLFVLVCLLCVSNSSAQMRQLHLDAIDENNEVQEFSFYSPNEGFVAFTKWIGYTTDSGRSFTRKYITMSNVNFNGYSVNLTFGFGIKGLKAFNKDTIIVYGDYGLVPSILYSVNGGGSYLLVHHDRYDPWSFKSGITDMVFPQNNNIGYAVEADRILKTTNKGLSWSVVKLDVNRYFDGLEALDNNNVIAFNTEYATSKIYKTANGGATWEEMNKPAGQLGYAYFLTTAKGWVIMRNDNFQSLVYYTSNGGASWTSKNDAEASSFYSWKFRFINDSTGYGLSGLFRVYKTTDSGKVWQPLPRDNNFDFLGYSFNDLHFLNDNQFWAGGGHGFLEMSTNGGGAPLPTAYFRIDTAGLAATNIVNLRNYSKPVYQYKWFKNGVQISTNYHTSYTHDIFQSYDTIALVVSDGVRSDTQVQYIYYNPPVLVTSFTPGTGATNSTIVIKGLNFYDVQQVSFGGVPAASVNVINDTTIHAVVGNGASGEVRVITGHGTGSRAGFTYIAQPLTNLPTSIADSILCKSESVTITIQNSEPGVQYQLIDAAGNYYAATTSGGGTINLISSPISVTGTYRIRAFRPGTNFGNIFPRSFYILVEHTKSVFGADQINLLTGEAINYANQSREAETYNWTLYQDASIPSATTEDVLNVTYASGGQKTLRLISISHYGCRDTLSSNAVFVYTKPTPDASCFINLMDSAGTTWMGMGEVFPGPGDVIYAMGGSPGGGKLRSTIGVAKQFGPLAQSFLAKYSTDGVLKWVHGFRAGGGITAGTTDAAGNIYLTGTCSSKDWFYFNNGDSIRFFHQAGDTTNFGERTPGFIMKLDPNGKFLWYTLLYDHTTLHSGVTYTQPYATGIAIKDHHIILKGVFKAKLSYGRNGTLQQLYDFSNSAYYGINQNNFIIRINYDGSLVWNSRIESLYTNHYQVTDIALDKKGNSYITGYYENSVRFFDATGAERYLLQGTTGDFKGYIIKYDSLGSPRWYNRVNNPDQFRDAEMVRVTADDDGNSYAAATTSSGFTITHSSGVSSMHDLKAYSLMKFDTAGIVRWVVGSRYPNVGRPTAIYLKGNEIYAAGQLWYDDSTISNIILTSADGNNRLLTINEAECFVVKYDTAGNYKRVYTSGYNYLARNVSPSSLYSNSKGQFIMGGNADTYDIGIIAGFFGMQLPHLLNGGGDGFFAKMGPDFCMPALKADAGPDKLGCTNDTVSIGSRASGDYYSWTSDPPGFTSSSSNPMPRPKVPTTYFLKVTNEEGQAAYDTVVVTLRAAPVADAGPDTTVCSNLFVQIGTPAIAGNTYLWYLPPPFPNQSTEAQPYVNPAISTTWYLRVVGPNGCPAYDTIHINTVLSVQPMVGVQTANSTICAGSTAVFTAVPIGGGDDPSYQWQVNGADVGPNNDTFSINTLKNGDRISLTMTSSHQCATMPQAYSNPVHVTVVPVPTITVSGNATVTEGESTTITVTVTNAGTNPALEWQDSTSTHGWQALPAQATPGTYSYSPAKTGDKIRCVIKAHACGNPNIASAGLGFVVNKVTGIDPVPAARYGLRYYPNPATTMLIIDSMRLQDKWQQLEITSIDGRNNYIRMNVSNRTRVQVSVAGLSPGMHVAILRNREGLTVYYKFVKL